MRPYDVSMDATAPEYVCRHCDRHLEWQNAALCCPNCERTIPLEGGIPRFPAPEVTGPSGAVFDWLAPIYETPLWFGPLYRFVGGPTAPWNDRSRIASLLALEDDGRDETVLDVACGTGRFTRHIADDVAAVTGIDISDGMLERARRYAGRDGIDDVAFARMSADELWFDADAFDRVACCWALHLFPDVDATLAEIHRVLQPGGRFAGSALVDEFVFDVPPVRAVARGALDADPLDVEDLRGRIRTAGFSGIEFDRRGAALFFRADVE